MDAAKPGKARNYDRYKEHKGAQYSGMKVGASHKWYYDQGEWRERKLTPEEWNIYYQTTKRRAGKAPAESGVPVGTEYNWLIVAHQRVDKLDANSYMTCMEGKKFKVAHKRVGKDAWNVSEKAQRKKVIAYLEQIIEELREADEHEQLPWTVGEEDRIYGLEHWNKTELNKMAGELEIPNRSKMKRGDLLAAIKERLYRPTSRKRGESQPERNRLIRDERHRAAKEMLLGQVH